MPDLAYPVDAARDEAARAHAAVSDEVHRAGGADGGAVPRAGPRPPHSARAPNNAEVKPVDRALELSAQGA